MESKIVHEEKYKNFKIYVFNTMGHLSIGVTDELYSGPEVYVNQLPLTCSVNDAIEDAHLVCDHWEYYKTSPYYY